MKKKQDILIITIIILIIAYILIYNQKITLIIKDSTILWFNKVFPSLFPMFILNDLLLSYHIDYYICKIFKKNGLKYYVFIMSLLSGSPSSAYIIKRLYDDKIIDKYNANKLLSFTYFSSPLFLITMLSFLFTNKTTIIKIILIHYLSNFIISFFYKIETNDKLSYKVTKDFGSNFANAINKAINTLLMILGILTFYIIISYIFIDIFNLNSITSSMIKGILEVTQGLTFLNELFINEKLKIILATLYINFGGLSIHSQIKSIISDTSINYKYFLKGRIFQTLISLILILKITGIIL
ncbi:MAG: hypothetical protein IJO33_05190 [Bacilli bacterium]|nr:hypothetical protein [Bacilli bacterium]